MNRKLDLKVGQKAILKIERIKGLQMTLDNIDEWTREGEVVKVGRKYITVALSKYHTEQFDINNNYQQKTDSGADYELYLNKEEVIEEFKVKRLYWKIEDYFHYGSWQNFTLNQLERIQAIIDEGKE